MIHTVVAYGISGSEFPYGVDAPDEATESEIAQSAYAEHGRKLREGLVTEPLGPNFSVMH